MTDPRTEAQDISQLNFGQLLRHRRETPTADPRVRGFTDDLVRLRASALLQGWADSSVDENVVLNQYARGLETGELDEELEPLVRDFVRLKIQGAEDRGSLRAIGETIVAIPGAVPEVAKEIAGSAVEIAKTGLGEVPASVAAIAYGKLTGNEELVKAGVATGALAGARTAAAFEGETMESLGFLRRSVPRIYDTASATVRGGLLLPAGVRQVWQTALGTRGMSGVDLIMAAAGAGDASSAQQLRRRALTDDEALSEFFTTRVQQERAVEAARLGRGSLARAIGADEMSLAERGIEWTEEEIERAKKMAPLLDGTELLEAATGVGIATRSARLVATRAARMAGATRVADALQTSAERSASTSKRALSRTVKTAEQLAEEALRYDTIFRKARVATGSGLVKFGQKIRSASLPTGSPVLVAAGMLTGGAGLAAATAGAIVAGGARYLLASRVGLRLGGRVVEGTGKLLQKTASPTSPWEAVRRAAIDLRRDMTLAAGGGVAVSTLYALDPGMSPESRANILASGLIMGPAGQAMTRLEESVSYGLNFAPRLPTPGQIEGDAAKPRYYRDSEVDRANGAAFQKLSPDSTIFIRSLQDFMGDDASIIVATTPEDYVRLIRDRTTPTERPSPATFRVPGILAPIPSELAGAPSAKRTPRTAVPVPEWVKGSYGVTLNSSETLSGKPEVIINVSSGLSEAAGHEVTHAMLNVIRARGGAPAEKLVAAEQAALKQLGGFDSPTFRRIKADYEAKLGTERSNEAILEEWLVEHGSVILAGLPLGKMGANRGIVANLYDALISLSESIRGTVPGYSDTPGAPVTSRTLGYTPSISLLNTMEHIFQAFMLERDGTIPPPVRPATPVDTPVTPPPLPRGPEPVSARSSPAGPRTTTVQPPAARSEREESRERPAASTTGGIYAQDPQRQRLAGDEASPEVQAQTAEAIRQNLATPAAQRPPMQAPYNSALADEAKGTVGLTEPQRAEQRRLADEGARGGRSEAFRALYDKVMVPIRLDAGGKNVYAFSLDKVIRNIDMLSQWFAENPAAGQQVLGDAGYTSLNDPAFIADFKSYLDNQANGYRGDGQPITLPEGTDTSLVPPANPGYAPRQLSPEAAGLINSLMGVRNVTDWGPGASLEKTYIARLAQANGVPVVEQRVEQGAGGRQLRPKLEFNTTNTQLRQAGFDTNLFHVAIENLRLSRFGAPPAARPDLTARAPSTAFVQAGFMPSDPGTPVAPEPRRGRFANPRVREVADSYLREAGIRSAPHGESVPVNESLAKRIADAYEAATDSPSDPQVKAAYQALADQTLAQYEAMAQAGVRIEPWLQEGQPYANSGEMMADVRDNNRLYFFLTEQGFGTEIANPDNPMLQPSGVEVSGRPLLINDVFRAVHDYFGHAMNGYEFGPRGEFNAYLEHSRMFTADAVPALAAETLAQNSWVNYGPHLRDEAGNVARRGEPGYVPPNERPFAPQKNLLLPQELVEAADRRASEHLDPEAAAAARYLGWSAPTTSGPTEAAFMPAERLRSQVDSTLARIPPKANRQQIEAALRDGLRERGQLLERPVRREEMLDIKDELGTTLVDFLRDNPNADLAAIKEFVEANQSDIQVVRLGGQEGWWVGDDRYETEREAERARDRLVEEAYEDAQSREYDYYTAEVRGDEVRNQDGDNLLYVAQQQEDGTYSIVDSESSRGTVEVNVSADDLSTTLEALADIYNNQERDGEVASVMEYGSYAEDVPGVEKRGATGDFYGPALYDVYALKSESDGYRETILTVETPGGEGYTSSHFKDATDKYLAHYRADDSFKTADGRPVFVVEEIQSDLHQEGRTEGYRIPLTPERRAEVEVELDQSEVEVRRAGQAAFAASTRYLEWSERVFDLMQEYMERPGDESVRAWIVARVDPEFRFYGRLDSFFRQSHDNPNFSRAVEAVGGDMAEGIRLRGEITQAEQNSKDAERRSNKLLSALRENRDPRGGSTVDAPLKKSWHELAFKTALLDAIESGAQVFAWTPGDIQADRYSSALQKAVGEVEAAARPDGTYAVNFFGPTGNLVHARESATPAQISDLVGKNGARQIVDAANKARDAEGSPTATRISGANLKVGGEGMRAFYDRILVNFANDYLKRFGVKVGDVKVTNPNTVLHGFEIPADLKVLSQANGLMRYMPASREQAVAQVNSGELFGATFRLDGVTDTDSHVVVTFQSTNVPRGELTEQGIDDFANTFPEEVRNNPDIRVGIFNMETVPETSIDMNLALPQDALTRATTFARANGQESIWDGFSGSIVRTGGDGRARLAVNEIPEAVDYLQGRTDVLPPSLQGTEFRLDVEPSPLGDIETVGPVESQFMPAPPVDSPAFREWFGDSKIVDADGNPRVMYHGSVNRGVTEFDPKVQPVRPRTGPDGTYFTSDPSRASTYARRPGARMAERGEVVPVFLSMERPLDITKAVADAQKRGSTFPEAKKQALASLDPEKHDGYIFRGDRMNHDEYFVFEPTQIKSATGNVGTFDPTNPDIRFMPAEPLTTQFKSRRKRGSLGGVQQLVHFSSVPLETLDPVESSGRGAATATDLRGLPRGYFYRLGKGAYEEAITSRQNIYLAQVDGNAIYNLAEDPLGYAGIPNRERADQMLRDAGFVGMHGISSGVDMVAMFDPVKLTEATRSEARIPRQPRARPLAPMRPLESEKIADYDTWFEQMKNREVAPRNRRLGGVNPQAMPSDQAYLDAVERGDMVTAQRMVDEAAKLAGVPILDDSASEAFRARRAAPPRSTLSAYKLFTTKTGRPGELFPLFVGANESIPQGAWLDAIEGTAAAPSKTGRPQVKSKLGPLAFRPGWHAGDLPIATHIGVKDSDGKVFARRANEVWAEVSLANDVDYQPQADASRTKDLREMPVDGAYRFKTNPTMTGSWIISGSMRVNRVLTQVEVDQILEGAEVKTMPWVGGPLDLDSLGLSSQQTINQLKLNDPVTYDDNGNVIPLSERFQPDNPDIRFMPGGPLANETRAPTFTPLADPPVNSAMDVLYGPQTLAPKEGEPKRGLPQVADILSKAAARVNGRRITSKDITPEEFQYIEQVMTEEVREALRREGHAGDWYTADLERFATILEPMYPELNDAAIAADFGFSSPAHAKTILFTALAITSQNLNVTQNTQYGLEQYEHFRQRGEFDPSREYGNKAGSISANLELANLTVQKRGLDGYAAFLNHDFTVAELSKRLSRDLGKKVTIAGRKSDMVKGSAMFGPKIGQGFLQNLMGNLMPVTVDLWLRRTWGRLSGDVKPEGISSRQWATAVDAYREVGVWNKMLRDRRAEGKETPRILETLRVVDRRPKSKRGQPYRDLTPETFAQIKNDTAALEAMREMVGQQATRWARVYKTVRMGLPLEISESYRRGDLTLEQVDRRMRPVLAARERAWDRHRERAKQLRRRPGKKKDFMAALDETQGRTHKLTNAEISEGKPKWALATERAKDATKPTDAPTDQDREVIKRLFDQVQKNLSDVGIEMSIADIQATLWYPEKDIWSALMGEGPSKLKNSYGNEALRTAEKRGLGDQARDLLRERGLAD